MAAELIHVEWQWRFRFCQIQDGGSAAILENSNGDISVADRPIYFVFGSTMGFSGSENPTVEPNMKWIG